jgi:hypothetical protein
MCSISNPKRRDGGNRMDTFEQLIEAVRSCSQEQKQQIFSEIRDSILIHQLERTFGVRAEVILEAISRAGDLTQRGIRGVIAETVFVLDILPTATGWLSDPPVGDVSYDACLEKSGRRVHIQVKTQRRERGQPMVKAGSYVVEVQRTRGGKKNGISTRPYRFGEFDLLAVCMWASTGDWNSFLYMPAQRLIPDPRDKGIIKTMQPVPNFENDEVGDGWTRSLAAGLEYFSQPVPNRS